MMSSFVLFVTEMWFDNSGISCHHSNICFSSEHFEVKYHENNNFHFFT